MRNDEIHPRRLRFHLPNDLPKYWNDHCPVKTYLLNAIAVLTPSFERLAIASVLPFKDSLPSESILFKQLQGFIGQESAHGSEFIRFNHILKSQYPDLKILERMNLKQFKWLAQKLSPKMHLSFTLAAEHLTAVISDLLLREEAWLDKAFPACAALWRWHAIEEIEHKAVAYDLYQALGGSYLKRILGMLLMTGMLVIMLTRNFGYFAKKDKLRSKVAFWWHCLNTCWGRKGFIRKLILPYLRYYLPRFHPWQQDNGALIADWKIKSPNISDSNK